MFLLVVAAVLLLGGALRASAAPATLEDCTKAKDISAACSSIWFEQKCDQSEATTGPCSDYMVMSIHQCQAHQELFKTNAMCKWYVNGDIQGGCKVNAGVLGAVCSGVQGVGDGAKKAIDIAKDPAGALASAAFDAVSGKFGSAAVKILHELTGVFMHVSTINLKTAGISSTYSLTWALSATIALVLLLGQFARLALTGQGQAGATAVTGLVKWALISAATLAVTQTALTATDEISTAIITSYYKDGEADFQKRIDSGFGHFFTTPSENTAMVLLFGVLSILVVLVLWGEMLLRQAALQVLLVVMPIVAAGSMNDATREWWPKARNAVISLILIKPIIVLILVIGFRETGQSSDMQPFLVGLLTIVLGALAWPSLAKFMTFTSSGSGGGLASGLLGAAGGTAGSMFAFGGGVPSGAGAAGGGRAYTKAVELENDGAVASGAGRATGGQGAAGGVGKAAGAATGLVAAAMAVQVAKAGKEVLEGGMDAMSGHADLGQGGSNMGGQVQLPRRGLGGGAGGGGTAGAPVPPQRPEGPTPARGDIPPDASPPPPPAGDQGGGA